MSFDKKSLNTDSNEGSVTEGTYLTSILSVVNGFCKVNLEVKLTKSFYSKDSLLPINAKVNNDYCMQQKSLNTDISKSDEYIENISQSNNSSNDEFQIYSRPSYSASVLNNDKKLNLVSRVKEQSTSNNVITEPSGLESLHTNQNPFKDYNISQDNNEDLEIGFKQREHRNKRLLKSFNKFSILDQGSDIAIQNDNSLKQSECPLCFKLYRSQDIEAHASGCSI